MLVVLNDDRCGRRVAQPRSLGTTSTRTLASKKVAFLLHEDSEGERGQTGTSIALEAPPELADFLQRCQFSLSEDVLRAAHRSGIWYQLPAGFG